MDKVFDFIDEELLNEATCILEDLGMDIETAIRMTLKKIVKEEGISFLVSNTQKNDRSFVGESNEKMTKNKAIAIFRQNGITFSNNVTFASKNSRANNYWANPNFDVLKNEWYLILNDNVRKELRLFVIPENAINEFELVARSDKENLIDLQIMYDDYTYTDSRSKLSFSEFLVETIQY